MSLTNPNKVITEERLSEFYQSILPYLGGMPEAVSVKDDLPVGTIIYIDGTTVPEGWLLCDGSTKNISSYPVLATYFQTQHGKKNYYGGNGSSTFGLPSYRRMPGNTSDCFVGDTTERIIGCKSNGKPIYQKTIETTFNADSSIKTISLGFNVDYIVIKSAFCVVNGSRTPIPTIMPSDFSITAAINAFSRDNAGSPNAIKLSTNNSTFYGARTYVTVQYDKTSDSAVPAGHSPDKNGIWIIKAKSMTAEDYSTDERIVGTWIDGKPIYQKTVYISNLPNTTFGDYPLNINNLERAWIVTGFAFVPSSAKGSIPIECLSYDDNNHYITAMIHSSGSIRIRTNADRSTSSAYVTVQYIKTTD